MDKVAIIGGSAGSLVALQTLLSHLPSGCGLSYVVIQHLSQDYESQLGSLIPSWTSIPVSDVKDGTVLKADHIYVAPAGRYMHMHDDKLQIREPTAVDGGHKPIDYFCSSLASQQAYTTSLIVLSGTGDDGTSGATAIRNAGGIVIAQEPQSAGYDSMPASVIDAQLADLVLHAELIGNSLCEWSSNGRINKDVQQSSSAITSADALHAIIKLVADNSNKDLSGYKTATLRRRIERRMSLQHTTSMQSYLEELGRNKIELDQLCKDLLIGVTSFFRDPEAFELLAKDVIPALCKSRKVGEPLRVWIAGCSTGEEAYSIAILLMEWFISHEPEPQIQIFATDVDTAALEIARKGVYLSQAMKAVSPERVEMFFKQSGDEYQIDKSVRETIVFAAHNLISDPPFSKLDLVVCRNVLIYLNSHTQKQLIDLFRFVINSGGYLFLGGSESIGSSEQYFDTISKQWRIFKHMNREALGPLVLPMSIMSLNKDITSTDIPPPPDITAGQVRLFNEIIEQNGPAHALINSHYHLLYVAGDLSEYIKIPAGPSSHDFLKMIKPELAMPLRSAVKLAQEENTKSSVNAIITDAPNHDARLGIRIEVCPVEKHREQVLFLVSISPQPLMQASVPVKNDDGENWVLQQLVHEINVTREDLQRTIDMSRLSSEDMKASNEEVMAMNEELQSANEELESSKEELQSLNEELAATNANLATKLQEIDRLNIDLKNLLDSTETATVLLDENLCIYRFTPACSRLMRIIPGDIGRPFGDLVRLFDDPELDQDIKQVLKGVLADDVEISVGKEFYVRRTLTYAGEDNKIIGVVVTFPEITTIKRADEMLRAHSDQLQWQSNLISRSAPIIGKDLQDRIIFWNKGAEDLYGWTEEEALNKVSHNLLATTFPVSPDLIKNEVMDNGSWQGELISRKKNGLAMNIDSIWSLYRDDSNQIKAIIEVNYDVTQRNEAERALRAREYMFRTMMDWTFSWEYWVGLNGNVIYMTPSAERVTGYTALEFTEEPDLIGDIIYHVDRNLWERHSQHIKGEAVGDVQELVLRIVRKNGDIRWVSHTCRPVLDGEGNSKGRRVTVRDISAQKAAEEEIRSLAYYDSLTHLPNRRLIIDRMGQALVASKRSQHYGAVLMLDLDHFKTLNDTQGHDVGDLLLVEVANRLLNIVRRDDTVSRLGGDEYLLLLERLGETESSAAIRVDMISEKISDAISKPYILGDNEIEYWTTCSIGITLFCDSEISTDVLTKQADLAMYQAKDSGRNVIRYFNPEMQAKIDKRSDIDAKLHVALEDQQFQLYYQPQFNNDGTIFGAEALIRWNANNGQPIQPDDFIPIAEETGLILKIGDWVLETACAQLKTWQSDTRCSAMTLSVNISAMQVFQHDFCDKVEKLISIYDVNTNKLLLEITETAVLSDVNDIVLRMHKLRQLGIHFSLDDFGTGYSSLTHLRQFPLSQIKIDRSFIRDVIDDPDDASIVRAILSMSEALGYEVVAEGVETEDQLAFLKQHGCNAYQGYHFARPMPIDEFEALLGCNE